MIPTFLDLTMLLPMANLRVVSEVLAEAARRGIKVVIVTLTGGPLAGKSTGLIRIEYDFMRRGWFVVSVPEAATIVRNAGFKAETGVITNYAGQREMIRVGENLFVQMLVAAIQAGHKQIMILRDRSSFDCAAYMQDYDEFVALLHEMGIDVSMLNSSDKTVFLDSLGVDNPTLYDELCSNNTARHENAEQAAAANERLVKAYEHFGVQALRIGNGDPDGAEGKNRAIVNALLGLVGEPTVQSQRAFAIPVGALDVAAQVGIDLTRSMQIRQFYLDGWRYRETLGPDLSRSYVATKKVRRSAADPVVRYKEERSINAGEFFYMHRMAAQLEHTVVGKTRYFGFCSSAPNRRLITVDRYRTDLIPSADRYCRVEIDNLEPGQESGMPDIITHFGGREVTGQIQHSDEGLATGKFVYPF